MTRSALAWEGPAEGDEGVGEAGDRVTAAGPSQEGEGATDAGADDLTWLDGDELAEAATRRR